MPANGKLLWKFNTIARSGEPGGDTWGNLPNMLRVGGETWITGSYDPELNLTYWGVAQAKPWMQASRGTKGDGALHEFDAGAPPGRWQARVVFPARPRRVARLDEVFERVLVDIGDRKTVFTIGKAGILWKLDRKTGKFLDAKETVFQNIFTHRSRRPASSPTGPTLWSRKSANGSSPAPAPKAATTGKP